MTGGSQKLRAWIVDDEPLARERVRELLKEDPEVEVAGESPNGRHALEALSQASPDLLFLDVQMPELDGFQVLEQLPEALWPAIVFVTAYDQHAVRAFDVHAVDYLLKPYDRERFRRALDRAKENAEGRRAEVDGTEPPGDWRSRWREVVREMRPEVARRLAVHEDGKLYLVQERDIDWVEAAGNYVKLHLGKQTHLHREPLKDFEGKLDPERFLRIHRSILVNLDRVRSLEPWFHGGWLVVLEDGTELQSSRGAVDKLKARFGR